MKLFIISLQENISAGSVTHAQEIDELIHSEEVKQWESGKSLNDIAAKQGITIRRSCRPSPPAGGGMVPTNILEQIIWDKEVEVIQARNISLFYLNIFLSGVRHVISILLYLSSVVFRL